MTESRAAPLPRAAFRRFYGMETRWNDMDFYGHMNNAVYLEYFDSALNRALIEGDALNLRGEGPIGVVAQTMTNYFSELVYPDRLEVGLCVNRIGRSSLTWGFGLFVEGAPVTAATGHYVHVYVDRVTHKPVPLTAQLQALAETLVI